MASDDPIEPIQPIRETQVMPARGLRDRDYRVFSRLLENLLRWKRFDFGNEFNKKQNRPRLQEPPLPDKPHEPTQFDGLA